MKRGKNGQSPKLEELVAFLEAKQKEKLPDKTGRKAAGPNELPSIMRLQGLLEYYPKTGEIRWKSTHRLAGTPGKRSSITIDRKNIPLHRAAWAIYWGFWPKGHLDHINRDPSDNRITNLRVATVRQNNCNAIKKRGKLGYRGVVRAHGGRYSAKISYGGRNVHLGNYSSPEEAARIYNISAQILHGEFAVLNNLPRRKQST